MSRAALRRLGRPGGRKYPVRRSYEPGVLALLATSACGGLPLTGTAGPGNRTFTQLAAGGDYTCGLRADGSVTCWGYNSSGQAAPPSGTFAQVAAGGMRTCGLRTDGTVTCWGAEFFVGSGLPMAPEGTFTQISAGSGHACALGTDGTVACWGHNEYGAGLAPVRRVHPGLRGHVAHLRFANRRQRLLLGRR